MIETPVKAALSPAVKTVVVGPAGPPVYIPETLPGFITGMDGADAPTMELFPATTRIDKMLDKSPLALEYAGNATNGPFYDAAGRRVLVSPTGSGLIESGFSDKDLSGRRSITVGATVLPLALGSNYAAIFSVSSTSFQTLCFCAAGQEFAKKQFRFGYGGNIFNVEGPEIGRTDSVVFRYEYISPGVSEYTFWLNGAKNGPLSGGATTPFPSQQYLGIGAAWLVGLTSWDGYLYQMAAYNEALSDADVLKLIAFLDAKK